MFIALFAGIKMHLTTEDSMFLTTDLTPTRSNEDAVNLDAEYKMRIVYLVIGSLGMLGNFIVVCVILRSPRLRATMTNVLIVNQSLIDFSAAFFIVTSSVIRNLPSNADQRAQDIFCRLWKTNLPIWGLFVSSTYNLVTVTLDRYMALVYPMTHKHRCSRTIVYVIIAVVWLFGPGFNAAYMIPTAGLVDGGVCTVYSEYPSQVIQRFVGILTVVLQYFIPLFLITFAYTRIVLVLRRGLKMTKTGGNDVTSDTREQRMLTASQNVIKTLLIVSVSFVACWSPNQIYYTMYNCGFQADFNSTFYHFTVVAVFINCCVNPFIYSLKYEQFQQELIRQITCRKLPQSTPPMVSREFSTITTLSDEKKLGSTPSVATLP